MCWNVISVYLLSFSQAYKTVSGDSERYEDRLANMGSTAKGQLPDYWNTHKTAQINIIQMQNAT